MAELMSFLRPEIALFAGTCVVMLLGLSKSYGVRKACAVATAIALGVAGILALDSPAGRDGSLAAAILPNYLPFVKSMIAAVALLILPMLSGVVDRPYERAVARGEEFDPSRATRGEFYAFFLFSVMGVMLCATADDLIWLFLALELVSLPTYIMVAVSSPRLRSQEAAVKYFFLGAFGAAVFLYGFALLYGATGTTSLPGIRDAFAAAINRGEPPLNSLALAGMVMAIVGVSFKIAAVPMHFYTPDVYQGAATPVAGYLAFAPKAAGFLVLIPLLATVGWTYFPADPAGAATGGSLPPELRVLLWVMAALTMTVGNVLAALQTNVKRMLAYSSVSHSGYILVGLVVGPGMGPAGSPAPIAANGLAAALFYVLCYGVMNLGAFAALASLQKRNARGEAVEIETLDDLRGMCRRRPLPGWAMVICSLSLLGMPPLLGFWGKLALFTSAISAGEILLVVVMGLNSAIAAYYYLRIAASALLDPRDEAAPAPEVVPAGGRRLAAVLSAAGTLALLPWVADLHRASAVATRVNTDFAAPIYTPPPKARTAAADLSAVDAEPNH